MKSVWISISEMLLLFLESGSEWPYQRCHAEWPEIVCPFAKGNCTQIRCQSHAFTIFYPSIVALLRCPKGLVHLESSGLPTSGLPLHEHCNWRMITCWSTHGHRGSLINLHPNGERPFVLRASANIGHSGKSALPASVCVSRADL